MALCRSKLVYISGKLKVKVEAEARIGALKVVRVGMGVPLPLMGTFSASSSLLVGARLRQVLGLAI